MLPFCAQIGFVGFRSTLMMSSVADAPSGNIDRLTESAVTFCACDLWHVVFDGCLVDQQGRAFASVDERIAGHSVTREAVGQNPVSRVCGR